MDQSHPGAVLTPARALTDATPAADAFPDRIVPPPTPARDDSLESPVSWGFGDTDLDVLPNRSVIMTGNRYALCGDELPLLVPWVEEQIELKLDITDPHLPTYPPHIPEPVTNEAFLVELRELLAADAISDDPEGRLRRGHGHTQEEMYAIRYGGELPRIPDVVVFPSTDEQVIALVTLAARHNVSLVPYGGGTNVSAALRLPSDETRMVVSVDTGRMNQILWIDPTNHMACIQAGAVGRDIVEQLARYGFGIGHEPDSIEFSTLGGWIATNASGMKKNRYGNIEDIVLDCTVVTPQGVMSQVAAQPRTSVGIDPRTWIFGSEGTLGIITSAVVKIFPLPEVQEYDAILFKEFEQGAKFLYDLQRAGAAPASVRLMDNTQFLLGQTLKPAAHGMHALKSRFEKWFVTRVKGFEVDRMVAATLVYEGTKEEVAAQKKTANRIAKKYRGMSGGASNGERGYMLTFAIAYLRDFVFTHWIIGESFETSVPWSQATALCDNVKKRVREEHTRRGLPGKPFICCRITQLYDTGVCIYFYYAWSYRDVENASETFSELEHIAREEILRSGGSLSHHHGVGKHRQDFLPRVMSNGTLAMNSALKRAVDPTDIFGVGNTHPGIDD